MAAKPKSKPKGVSKKTPIVAAKKIAKTASKKIAVKKVAAKKIAVKKAPSKKGVARSGVTNNTVISVSIPLAYTLGTLSVEDGIAGLIIDEQFYPFGEQMGHPICFLYPITPAPDHHLDLQYLEELKRVVAELVLNVLGISTCRGTCCP